LRDDLTVVVETEYVDKVYRNSFYGHYATKLRAYDRNCIRLSFFEPQIQEKTILNTPIDHALLQRCFLGFLVIRPLSSSCIGRNVLSPRAKKPHLNHMCICSTVVDTTVFGLQLKATGFPHASQDGELMSCAENAIWSVLDYFGNKYPEYRPLLPCEIIESLKPFSFERQTPSSGLTFEQISVVLQRQGFGCKVYAKENPMFKEVFTCYVESGLPLIVCMQDEKSHQGHAVVCVGRKKVEPTVVRSTTVTDLLGTVYRKWNLSVNEFIFNDDNVPCYQSVDFSNPMIYYGSEWSNMVISHMVVPLPARVYLDAELAIKASTYIASHRVGLRNGSVVKTFLVSNRSYREYLLTNPSFSENARWKLLQINMPKFIWVTEIAQYDDFVEGAVNELLILDATGSAIMDDSYASLLYFQKQGKGTCFSESTGWFEEINGISFPKRFNAYNDNLHYFDQ